MGEKILVTDAKIVNTTIGEAPDHLIQIPYDSFVNTLKHSHLFIERAIAESNNFYKQIVSYCLITYADSVFLVQRTNKQTESRLHNCYSVGIGGHIDHLDSVSESPESILEAGMLRELHEEVNIQCPYHCKYYGIINDNTTDVNAVHVGLCYVITLDKKECSVREIEKMKGRWINLTEVDLYYDKMEKWSQILLHSYRAL